MGKKKLDEPVGEVVLCYNTGEPLDLTGWELSGSVNVRDPDGSLWENRSYRQDLDKDGNFEVITGRVLLEAAPEPEPEPEPVLEEEAEEA